MSPAVLTVQEVAALLRISGSTVGAMVRDGRLPRVPGIRPIRIPAAAVSELLGGAYIGTDESDRQAPAQAPASRRGNRRPPDRQMAGEAVGGRGPLHRCIGSAPGDVAVRCVTRRGGGAAQTKLLPRVSKDAARRLDEAIG